MTELENLTGILPEVFPRDADRPESSWPEFTQSNGTHKTTFSNTNRNTSQKWQVTKDSFRGIFCEKKKLKPVPSNSTQ